MRRDDAVPTVVVNDASCLIDLRKGRLLAPLMRLPYRFLVPYPVRASELLSFSGAEWALIEELGMEIFDLPADLVKQALSFKAKAPGLSANDCFCLVTALHHPGAILLTGDAVLRKAAAGMACPVHGVL